jgi:hypothetical protein
VRSGSPHQDGTVPGIGTDWECVRVVKCRGRRALHLGRREVAMGVMWHCVGPELAVAVVFQPGEQTEGSIGEERFKASRIDGRVSYSFRR